MQLDPGAVNQIARAYHGYYPVKGGSTSHVLRFDNDFQEEGGSSLDIDCAKGIITIRLRTPHRGKSEVVRQAADYNTLHQVFKDPRCFFLPAIIKPKRRSSRELSGEGRDDEPVVFSISAYKNPVKPAPVVPRLPMNGMIGPGLLPRGALDLGAPLCEVLGPKVPQNGPRVPAFGKTTGPRVPMINGLKVAPAITKTAGLKGPMINCPTEAPADNLTNKGPKVDGQNSGSYNVPVKVVNTLSTNEKKAETENKMPKTEHTRVMEEHVSQKVFGPAKPDPALLPREAVDQDLQSVDQLYRTKTRTELNYLKRKQQLDTDRLKKKAVLSHKDKIEGFNTYLGNLPEFNEQRKINWSKH